MSVLSRGERVLLQRLCASRHPILSRKWAGKERPDDAANLAKIETRIDELEMKELAPAFAAMEARIAELNRIGAELEELRKKYCL